jgi:gamma-glutamyltranspeptidase/glutathione hydrolase
VLFGSFESDDERRRRRPVRHRLQREGPEGPRAERQRTRAGGGDADEFKKRNLQRDAAARRAVGQRAGVVDGWNELLPKHGTRTLAQALEPAIATRATATRVSEIIADQWKRVESLLARDPNAAAIFLPAARRRRRRRLQEPRAGRSLEQIAKGGRDVFYKGAIAQAIADDMRAPQRLLTARTLADHHADWVEPLSTTYRGYQVLELPPNTQGVRRSRC